MQIKIKNKIMDCELHQNLYHFSVQKKYEKFFKRLFKSGNNIVIKYKESKKIIKKTIKINLVSMNFDSYLGTKISYTEV